MAQPPAESKPEATPVEPPRDLGRRARSTGVIVWSAFLAAALATMLCFAFLDPLGLRGGNPPRWWTTRMQVYGVGFFFFWLVGLIAAGLCVQLSRGGRRDE